jgi:formylglycine-generating enzyme required for sulfatase activity
MAILPAGEYLPFYTFAAGPGQPAVLRRPVSLRAFRLDRRPVTNAQFLSFLRAHPEWRRSQVKSLFAERRYLAKWRGDLEPPEGEMSSPVTDISWFAAQAFCEARGLRLPTTDEWEYALDDSGRDRKAVAQASLDWFAAPNPPRLPPVGRGEANGYGLQDLVGLVWEWTQDFSAYGSATEQRNTASQDTARFCSGSALGVRDAADYPAFQRFALRSSLQAAFTQDNLGFRCAGDE